MAPTYVLAYNTGDSPVVVDSLGRTIGGHEWAPARRGEVLDAAGNNATVVVLTKIDEDSAGPEALAAYHQVDDLNRAAEAYANVDAGILRDVADTHAAAGTINLPAGDDEPIARADLVDLLVRAGVAPPPARPKRSSSSSSPAATAEPEE